MSDKHLKDNLRSILYVTGSLLLIAGAVCGVRCRVGESFRISTSAMAEALQPGDYILVNKLPKAAEGRRNRVVLFHSPLRKDSLNCPLFISRVLGVPGDTIEVRPDGYLVNGKAYPRSPQSLSRFFVSADAVEVVRRLLRQLGIPEREWQQESFGCTLSLTRLEEYRLRSEMPEALNDHLVNEQLSPYRLVVPRKGIAYRLDGSALTASREILERETAGNAEIRGEKLFLDGRETNFFFFKQDYFWVLSDNNEEGIDSRHLGFIPADQLVGEAWFIWYSTDKQRRFKWIH